MTTYNVTLRLRPTRNFDSAAHLEIRLAYLLRKDPALGLASIRVEPFTPPQPDDPHTCGNCRFGKEQTFNGGLQPPSPGDEHYTCSRNQDTTDAHGDPCHDTCPTWQRRQTAAQDADDLFGF